MEHHWQQGKQPESIYWTENVEGWHVTVKKYDRDIIISQFQHLNHRNIIRLISSFCRDRKLYLVTELTHDNLNNIIRTQRLKSDDVRYIIFQILNGLNYLHNCGITHGDLKPSDIGLNKDFSIKIIDLNVEQPKEADYVLTKWFVCLF